jgi:hypothetical protein
LRQLGYVIQLVNSIRNMVKVEIRSNEGDAAARRDLRY